MGDVGIVNDVCPDVGIGVLWNMDGGGMGVLGMDDAGLRNVLDTLVVGMMDALVVGIMGLYVSAAPSSSSVSSVSSVSSGRPLLPNRARPPVSMGWYAWHMACGAQHAPQHPPMPCHFTWLKRPHMA